MTIGIVKFFDNAKGFGFIVPEDGGKDIFVHKAAIESAGIQNPTQGLRLSFETERSAKGAIQASNLKPHLDEGLPGVTIKNSTASGYKRISLRPSDMQNKRSRREDSAIVRRTELVSSQHRSKASANSSDWRRSYDRYCDLARDAHNDFVTSQNYWQHAEHFLRMMNGSAT